MICSVSVSQHHLSFDCVTCVDSYYKFGRIVRVLKYWWAGNSLYQIVECIVTLLCPYEFDIFSGELSQWSGYNCIIFDKSSIIVRECCKSFSFIRIL